jgi:hypothetical protein
MQFSCTGRIPL